MLHAMECKTTFSRTAQRQRAFTLTEMLMTIAISSFVFMAIASLSLYTGRSFAALTNYVDLDSASRTALDTMTRDIRQVTFLMTYNTNRVVFSDDDGTSLTYTYDSGARTLTRLKGTERKVLLRECDSLIFNMWQRNPVAGTFELVATTNPDLCKAIDVTWVCSRKILGQKVNTESVQTARIVIRKQQD